MGFYNLLLLEDTFQKFLLLAVGDLLLAIGGLLIADTFIQLPKANPQVPTVNR